MSVADFTNAPPSFQMVGDYACYRPSGQVLLSEAIDQISTGIAFAHDHQIERLLVDSTQFTGFGPLSTSARFWMAERFVAAAKSRVKVALLARIEWIDPEHFGVTVARNLGMQAEVFDSEADALEWLLNDQAGSVKKDWCDMVGMMPDDELSREAQRLGAEWRRNEAED